MVEGSRGIPLLARTTPQTCKSRGDAFGSGERVVLLVFALLCGLKEFSKGVYGGEEEENRGIVACILLWWTIWWEICWEFDFLTFLALCWVKGTLKGI